MLNDGFMTNESLHDEQHIALSLSSLPETFQRLKYTQQIKCYEQILTVTSQLIEHLTFHTGLVSDKHKLGIGKRCIYRSLDKNKISFLLGKKCRQKLCKVIQ